MKDNRTSANSNSRFSVSAYFFLLFAGLGFYSPYIGLYLERRGWNGSEIGIAFCVATLFGLFGQILFGRLADLLHQKSRILIILTSLTGIIAIATAHTTGLFLVLTILGIGLVQRPLIPLADSAAFDYLGGKKRENYGYLRIFGTIGFLFANGIAWLTIGRAENLKLVFYGYGIVMIAAAFVISKFPSSPRSETPHLELGWLRNKKLFLLTAAMFFLELSSTSIQGYLGVFMNDHFPGRDQLIPLAWAIGVGIEIFVMGFSPRWLKRMSMRTAIVIAGTAASLRYLFLATVFSHSLPLFFLSQTLHGVYYGLFFCAALAYVDQHCPEEQRASVQSSVSALSSTIGYFLGFIVNGWLWHRFGLSSLFLFSGCMGLVGICIIFHPQLRDLNQRL